MKNMELYQHPRTCVKLFLISLDQSRCWNEATLPSQKQ